MINDQMTSTTSELSEATRVLARAGIESARSDAEWLFAHVLDVDRGRLAFVDEPDATARARYRDLVARRARRIPLQHIIGRAAFGPVDVAVGPGVFVPRPETEVMLEWAVESLRSVTDPLVADLCSGSGALAIAIAVSVPSARVVAVEKSPAALLWLRRNVENLGVGDRVAVLGADVTDHAGLREHIPDGSLDLVVANPPYVPADTEVSPEVDADPAEAVFAGSDGMAVITPLANVAVRLLAADGFIGVEHDDSTSSQVVDAFTATGSFEEVLARRDLAGRPRFVTARRRR
ncbi:protein methyltransferase HemK [Gordonia otitidis NBRC 100426]|uniref:Release factor glutamine methyltransferase n=2 Tax=Gordonia otitidis TaxID=249058 RepID=H5TSV2_GORO1|nr:protein methyltransferase HemK [Gordonia otitidis NBRC 100426]